MSELKRTVYCNTCNENLDEDRHNWAAEHLKKYPNHLSFADRLLYTEDQKFVHSVSYFLLANLMRSRLNLTVR